MNILTFKRSPDVFSDQVMGTKSTVFQKCNQKFKANSAVCFQVFAGQNVLFLLLSLHCSLSGKHKQGIPSKILDFEDAQ